MTNQTTTDYTAEIAERTVVVTWPDNDRGGATPPPDGWADRAMDQEPTLHEVDEGSISGCSALRWRDDSRSDAELVAHSLMLVTGRPASAAPLPPVVQSPIREQLLNAIDFSFCQSLGFGTPEGLLAAYEASRTQAVDPAALREIAVQAIRDAACAGDCGQTEEECAKERIQPFAWHHGTLAVVEGSPEQFADAVLAVLPAPANHDTDTSVEDADADTVANRAAQVISAMGADIRELKRERDRSRTAWHSARRRASVLSAEITRRAPLLGEYATEIARLRRELAVSERIRENADFHLGQEMARRQRAEKETAELRRVADETAATETDAEPTAEEIARDHVTTLHLIGEQLSTIEGWFWEHLADVREAKQPAVGARQDGAQR